MTGTYETMVLLNNREVKKGWDACKKQICSLFEKHQAEIVSAKRWDELPLAFPVKRQLRGTYMLLYYHTDGDSLPAIRRELEYNETVLTHLTLVCEEIPEQAKEPEAAFDIESVRVEETNLETPKPPKSESAPKTESKSEPKTESKSEPKTEPKTEPKSEAASVADDRGDKES